MPILSITRRDLALATVVKLTISSRGGSRWSKPQASAALRRLGRVSVAPRLLGESPPDLDARGERHLPRGRGQADEADESAGLASPRPPTGRSRGAPAVDDAVDHLVALDRGERRREVLHHLRIAVERGRTRACRRRASRAAAAARCAAAGSARVHRLARPSSRARSAPRRLRHRRPPPRRSVRRART